MAALKKGGSGLMEVDEDNQKIRRCPTVPLPEWNDARREELMNSTVYVKGKMRYAFEFFLLQICIKQSSIKSNQKPSFEFNFQVLKRRRQA